MEKKRKITQYRERLDRTLASHNLTNKDALKVLVKDQLLRSTENEIEGCNAGVIEERTSDVSNLLDMLRSASVGDDEGLKTCETPSHPEWKLKQDNEEFRMSVYAFRVRQTFIKNGGLNICSEDEDSYYEDDLIVVLLNTISDFEGIDGGLKSEATNGEKDVVRIDVVGGFALQKVTEDRSYFRTISNMDIKMDFMPPSLINFISRQLIGNGFRLYQKVVSSKLSDDEDYSKALRGPLYSRIREALSSLEESRSLEEKKLNGDASNLSEEHLTKNKMNDLKLVDMNQKVDNDHLASEVAPDDAHVTGGNTFGEIEEIQSEKNKIEEVVTEESKIEEVESEESQIEEIESEKSKIEEVESKQKKQLDDQPSNRIAERFHLYGKRNMFISSEVEQAIGTLEKVILRVRQNRLNAEMQSSCFTNEVLPKRNDGRNPTSLEVEVHSSGEHFSEVPKKEDTGRTLTTPLRNSTAIQNISSAGSNSLAKEVNHNKVVPTSPLCSSKDGASEIPVEDNIMHSTNQIIFKTNDTHESRSSTRRKSMRQRRRGFCCFSISPTQIDS
ncbi:hypothetical protein M0R45_000071 [Rubus argutus]|uniref:Uncharacterized protein n=1 Tax=Rubus argutus TaxID=59490 RepID=A0AAW1VMT0_RUBAR